MLGIAILVVVFTTAGSYTTPLAFIDGVTAALTICAALAAAGAVTARTGDTAPGRLGRHLRTPTSVRAISASWPTTVLWSLPSVLSLARTEPGRGKVFAVVPALGASSRSAKCTDRK